MQYILRLSEVPEHCCESNKEAEVIAFPDLGAEAIYKLRVENFPVIVIIDNKGNDLYKLGKEKYKIV